MDLKEVHKLVVGDIHEALLFLTAGYPMTDSAQSLANLSELFQALAICHLLTDCDIDQFRENLVRSGRARRYFLHKCREEADQQNRFLALSRTAGVLDAIVAADFNLAREIAAQSSDVWEPRWEYEDDFCYFRFIHLAILGTNHDPSPELGRLAERFELVLEGAPSTRLEVCKALAVKDEAGFAQALQDLAADHEARLDKLRPTITPPKFLFWPTSFVFIEGLALLGVGESLGVSVSDDVPLCPRDARLPPRDHDYADIFAGLEKAIQADR